MGMAGTWQGSMTPRPVVVVLGQRSLTGDYLGGPGRTKHFVTGRGGTRQCQVDGSIC